MIYLEEDAFVIEGLLRMVCGLPLLPLETHDQMDLVLFAAEKYDMPGPMSILRLQIMVGPLLDEPFRLYAAARRHGWKEEAEFSSTRTLSYNIYDTAVRSSLQRMSTEAVLDLFELHHARRER